MVGAQIIDVINAINRLNPTDANVENPVIDPSVLSLIYGVDPKWVGLDYAALSSATTTINGAVADFEDTDASDWPTVNPVGSTFGIGNTRSHTVHANILGGATTPITIQLSWFVAGIGGFDLCRIQVTNPGTFTAFGVVAPPGFSLRLRASAGGAGDTVTVQMCGYQAPPGVGVPITSPFVIVSP